MLKYRSCSRPHPITTSLMLAAGLAFGSSARAQPVDSSFVYRGEIADGGIPVNGTLDVRFRLYDQVSGGVQVGSQVCVDNVSASNGRFSADLNFGNVFGSDRYYLEIDVRADTGTDCADNSGWSTLAPRQALGTVPYAAYTLNAATSTSATLLGGQSGAFYQNAANLTGTLPSAQMSGAYTSALTFSNASNSFSGNGAGITGLNAANVSSGILVDARLSSNVAMRNAPNTFAAGPNILMGQVGIGRTPGFDLDIGGATAASPRFAVDVATAGLVQFGNLGNDSHRAVLAGNGPVDIVIDANANDTTRALRVMRDGPSGTGTELVQVHESGSVYVNTAQVVIDGASGFVGVGTATPAFLFDAGTATDRLGVDVSTAGLLRIGNLTSDSTTLSIASRGDAEIVIDNNNNGNDAVFKFVRNGAGASVNSREIMRVQEAGTVAIGISTPDDTSLHTFTSTRATATTVESSLAGGVGLSVVSSATTGSALGGSFITNGDGATAVYARAESNSGVTYGVRAETDSNATNAIALRGEATRAGVNYGVYGMGSTNASSFGVYANGRLGSSGTKSFMIDHPLDPENKYLLHYSLESPEVLNVYSGVAPLDASGEAWITLPDYFSEINVEPRYLLTSVGGPAPMLHVASEIEGNTFKIAGGAPNAKVSWEVKAKRNDRFVQRYGAPSERAKVEGERGMYLRPELYNQADARGQFYTPQRPSGSPADNAH